MSEAGKFSSESAPDFAGKTHDGANIGASRGNGGAEAEQNSDRLRAVSEAISREFAPQLEHTALILYDRDPEHLQAQWYVTPEELAQARNLFPGGGMGVHQVLRLCRLDHDGRPQVVASIAKGLGQGVDEGQKGFDLHRDGAEYECELGLESDEGGWLLLARSNRLRTAGPSLPPSHAERAPERSPAPTPLHEGVEIPQQIGDILVEAALAADGEPLYPVFPNLEPDEVPTMRSATQAPGMIGQTRVLNGKAILPSLEPEQPAPGPLAESWTIPGAVLPVMPPPLLPSSPELKTPAGDMPGPVYDPRGALSSAALRSVRLPELDMEIQAELIVQGDARPDSTIDLCGQSVPVGADGHFYLRRPIDDPQLLSYVICGRPFATPGDPKTE